MEHGDGLEKALARLGIQASPEQISRLLSYERTLADLGVRAGVVAPGDRERLRERHLLDSARAVPVLPRSGLCCDLGSGGGLPGVVVAILAPELQVCLVERRGRKAGFLEHVVRELGLANAWVEPGPLEGLEPGKADAATARALAPLDRSWRHARRILRPGGHLVYFSGSGGREVPPSLTDAEILEVPAPDEVSGSLVIITRKT